MINKHKNPIKLSEKEICDLFEHQEKLLASGLRMNEYCIKNNLVKKKMTNFRMRLNNCLFSNPKEYKRRLDVYFDYLDSGLSVAKYCKKHGEKFSQLGAFVTHKSYMELLNNRIGAERLNNFLSKRGCIEEIDTEELTFTKIDPIIATLPHITSEEVAPALAQAPLPVPTASPEISIKVKEITFKLPSDSTPEQLLKIIYLLKEI